MVFLADNDDGPFVLPQQSPCQCHMAGIGSPSRSSPEPDEHMPWSPSSALVPLPESLQSLYEEEEEEELEAVNKYPPDPDDPADHFVRENHQQGGLLAEQALRYHNADPGNKVKYELVEAGLSNCMLTEKGTLYGHVNFTALPRAEHDESSPESCFFFAEVVWDQVAGGGTWIPTCLCKVYSEDEMVGGVADDPVAQLSPWNVSIDYCISCGDDIKHPKDGTCYKAGHFYSMLQ